MKQVLRTLGTLAVLCSPAAAGEPPSVPMTGQYVYVVTRPPEYPNLDTPEAALRSAAQRFWGSDTKIPALLAANRIADVSKLGFGTSLRIPAPLNAGAMHSTFVEGLRLEVRVHGRRTLRVDCDPCNTPRAEEENPEHPLALRLADDRGHTQHVSLLPLLEGFGYGAVTDLRAWNLPGGEVLLAVKTQSESGGAHWGVEGTVAFFRLGAGPRAELLQTINGDTGGSSGNGGEHDDVSMQAALEDENLVVTVSRARSYIVGEREEDGRVHTTMGESVFRQRLTYDAAARTLSPGPEKAISRRQKRWAEGETEPEAFTDLPPEP